ncbi:phosphatase PAP2 family protein [Flaviaesturariibacter flavus]|uniref:Phosphatase PAP2 family protein n=1 Tax=Flaviaesturariibacter flavus TaxID=2502780 RepID=A0A4R1BBZ4_9BACT|nr:phosphatase PAP2 family protein [Flaviaesturariibacter flavus]TCJ14546.1 phosphatase PAP2 family protein [Flaviaesturariibacter flavus]
MTKDTQRKTTARHLSIRVLAVAALFFGSLFLFSLIANEMVVEQEAQLDQAVFAALQPLQTPALTHALTIITFFGSAQFLLPAYLVVIGVLLFSKKYRRLSLDSAAVGITGTVILFSLKSIFHRPRPPHPLIQNVLGFSFPSGHSFSSFAFYGLLIYLLWKIVAPRPVCWILSILLFLFAGAIAFSRVYLQVHYASDVCAGFLLCIVWLILSFRMMRVIDQKLRPAKPELRVT